jgi:hypothetical protein
MGQVFDGKYFVAKIVSKTDGQCSNHCVPAFEQAFGRCGLVGAVNSADRQ